jgi:hypothetical protein
MGVRAAGAGTVAGIAKGLSGSGAAAEEDTSKKVRQRSADEASAQPTQPTPPQKSGKTYDPNMSVKGKLYEGRNPEIDDDTREAAGGYKRGGKVASKASSRGDGIAQRGKTKGRFV